MNSKRIIPQAAKGLADVAKGTVFEAVKQTTKVAGDTVGEIVAGGSSGSGQSKQQDQTGVSDFDRLVRTEELRTREEVTQLREQMNKGDEPPQAAKPSGPKRDVEKEIKEVREEKQEKEKKKDEEELLAKIAKQREEEEKAVQEDAAVLQATGRKSKKGSAFAIRQKQTKAETGRGAKH